MPHFADMPDILVDGRPNLAIAIRYPSFAKRVIFRQYLARGKPEGSEKVVGEFVQSHRPENLAALQLWRTPDFNHRLEDATRYQRCAHANPADAEQSVLEILAAGRPDREFISQAQRILEIAGMLIRFSSSFFMSSVRFG